ncbi:hypothetical protein J6590_002018 [Homalodisca vitripennis]|nr:hypothetical protein J6590_002018 [Homalodisca vitripennis]
MLCGEENTGVLDRIDYSSCASRCRSCGNRFLGCPKRGNTAGALAPCQAIVDPASRTSTEVVPQIKPSPHNRPFPELTSDGTKIVGRDHHSALSSHEYRVCYGIHLKPELNLN